MNRSQILSFEPSHREKGEHITKDFRTNFIFVENDTIHHLNLGDIAINEQEQGFDQYEIYSFVQNRKLEHR